MDRDGEIPTSHDGDHVLVTTEAVDVVLYPLQGKALIQQPGVGHAPLGLECRSAEEAECAETVVEGDVDDAIAAILLADLHQTTRVTAVVVILLAC